MASQLAQTAKVFKASLVGFVALFILYLFFTQTFSLIRKTIVSRRPVKATPPSTGFGKLPKLRIKSLTVEGAKPNYSLETTTGTLPPFPGKLKVFKFIEPQASFLSLEKTKSLAQRLGFQTPPEEISPSLYFWQENGRTLRANTVTGNFQVETDLSRLTLSVGDLPSPGEMRSTAKGYLDGRGLFKSGFDGGEAEVILVKKTGSVLSRALSLSEASLARIDFFRSIKGDEDKNIRILTQNPQKGLIELIYTGLSGNSFPKIDYAVWDFDFEKGETYPLLSIESVWQGVKNGQGLLVYGQYSGSDSLESLDAVGLAEVYIREVKLSYFDDEEIQSYLQPIYVFQGDGKTPEGKAVNLTIYFPAVDPAWTE